MFLKTNLSVLKGQNTYAELSKRTNVPQTTLKDIISGINQNPKLDTLINISKAFKISLDDLIFTELSKEGDK